MTLNYASVQCSHLLYLLPCKTQVRLGKSGKPSLMPPLSTPKLGQEFSTPDHYHVLPAPGNIYFTAFTTLIGNMLTDEFSLTRLLFEAKTMSYSSLYPYHLAQFLAHRKGSINKVSEGMKTAMGLLSSCSLHTPHPISNMSRVWNSASRPEAILLLGTFHSVWRHLGCHD